MGVRGDLRLMRQAVRWNTGNLKEKLIEKVNAAMDLCESPREVASIGALIATMERQNQQDEHSESAKLLARVLGQLTELGVDTTCFGVVEAPSQRTIEESS